MILSKSPFRVSFLGGGSDYPEWFNGNGGAVLSCTINKFAWLSCRKLPPFFSHTSRVVWSEIEQVKQTREIKHPSARACLELLNVKDVEVHYDGDLPGQSGVGSSSAFTVAMLHALHGLRGEMVSKERLAKEAIRIEREILGEAGGIQDQIACAFGGLNFIEFHEGDDDCFTVNKLPLPKSTIKELQANISLFFVGKQRQSAELAGEQARTFDQHQDVMRELTAMARLGVHYLSEHDIHSFGALVGEGWKLKKELSPHVSSEEIETVLGAAMEAGAYGGKLIGAGQSGFLLVFRRPERKAYVSEALRGLVEVQPELEFEGSKIVYWDQEPEHLTGQEGGI